MRRFITVKLLASRIALVCLLLSGLAIYACGSDTLAPTESGLIPGPSGSVATTSDGSGGETTDDSALQRGKADKVEICHIPPGNPDNAHVINVSANVVPAHVENHGDLTDFVVDDETGFCSAPPVGACPCFTTADIVVLFDPGEPDRPLTGGSPGSTEEAFIHDLVFENGPYIVESWDGNSSTDWECYQGVIGQTVKELISRSEHLACVSEIQGAYPLLGMVPQ